MRVSLLLKFNTVCNLIFGLVLIFIPGWMMSLYGVNLEAGGVYLARLAAAGFLGYAVITWFSRNLSDEQLRVGVLPGLFAWFVIGLLVLLYGQVSGITNLMGWFTILLSAFFVAGYAYFLVRPTQKKPTEVTAGGLTGSK